MKRKIVFFVILLAIIIVLFGFLYFLGLTNYFEWSFVKNIKWLEFDKLFAVFYLIILSIFLIVVVAIMVGIIISLKQEGLQLTSMNIDEVLVQKKSNENFSKSYDKLVNSLNKNINAIQKYTEVIDDDINTIDQLKIDLPEPTTYLAQKMRLLPINLKLLKPLQKQCA